MPNRPRAHQIETESRQAWEQFLGVRFVYKRSDGNDDYGLDGMADEFDTADKATGVSFYVQLKATDETDLAKALHTDLKRDTADLYRSLPIPVLMVRYVASSGRLFGRWFHRGDVGEDATGKHTVRFRWDPEDDLGSSGAEELARAAQAFLTLRSPTLTFPLSVYLDTPAGGAFGLSRSMLLAGLRAAAQPCDGLFRVQADPPPQGEITLVAQTDSLAANLAEVTTATVTFEGYDAGTHGDRFGNDAMTLLALAFERIGRTEIVVRLASEYLPKSSMSSSAEVAWGLAGVLRRTKRTVEAMRLADTLDASEDPATREKSFPFLLAAKWHGRTLSADALRLYEESAWRRVERRTALNENVPAAKESYNLANLHRSRSEPEKALPAFVRALELDPSYANRDYFQFEWAGMLFRDGQFAEAAASYERALELGGEPSAAALRADALMFAGRYAESQAAFATDRETRAPEDREGVADGWQLKERFLGFLVQQLGLNSQERDKPAAEDALSIISYDGTSAEIAEQLERVIALDALSGGAWFNLGRAHLDQGDQEGALWSYLGAAICQSGDAEAWANVVILAGSMEMTDVMAEAMICGARAAGEPFRQHLTGLIEQQGEDRPAEQLLEVLDEAFEMRAGKQASEGMILRDHQADGTIEQYVLPAGGEQG
jgi:tetratricopeptide (TPR) repeat protein